MNSTVNIKPCHDTGLWWCRKRPVAWNGLMIAKDESLFVVLDALNQICRHHTTGNLISHAHDVTVRVTKLSNTERFRCISFLRFFNDDAIVLVATSRHVQAIRVSMMIAQCQPYLGKADPSHSYISIVCWYASLSGGILVIKTLLKTKALRCVSFLECPKSWFFTNQFQWRIFAEVIRNNSNNFLFLQIEMLIFWLLLVSNK